MKFGVCASYRDAAALPNISFDYLEEHVQRFLMPEQPQGLFEENLRAARLLPIPIEAANCFLPATLPLIATVDQPVDAPRLERYVRTALQRADQVGIRVIVFGSGAARTCPTGHSHEDARQQLGAHLAQWSEWGRAHGVQIALEPLGFRDTNMLNTIVESGPFVDQLVSSGAKLLIDTYHMASNGENPADILPWGELLAHVHIAEQQDRAAPGCHRENFGPYFSVLRQLEYDQRISIECDWQHFANEVDTAIATLREQWMNSSNTA